MHSYLFLKNYQYAFDIHLFNTHAKYTSYSLTSKKPKYFYTCAKKGTKIVEDADKRFINSILVVFPKIVKGTILFPAPRSVLIDTDCTIR